MISPVAGRISRGFSSLHTALDIVNTYRTPIVAPEAGIVSYVGQKGSGVLNAGNVVQIGNPNGNAVRLCHLDSFIVRIGQAVKQGQVVGYMGYTGFTIPAGIGGTHLHFIVFRNGKRVNPLLHVIVPPVNNPVKPTSKMPPIGAYVHITINRTTFKAGTTTVAGTLKPGVGGSSYLVRGYDPKYSNRILVNTASGGGNGVALALYYTNGTKIEGWSLK